jgi:alpha-glucuronidase
MTAEESASILWAALAPYVTVGNHASTAQALLTIRDHIAADRHAIANRFQTRKGNPCKTKSEITKV